MEPKFQSSFIPKGPIAASGVAAPKTGKSRSLLGFLATLVFIFSIVLAAGVFGYNKFLSYRISQIGAELESARASLDSDAVQELIRLDTRLNTTSELLHNHIIVSPLFDFMEENTLQFVRFTDFSYEHTDNGIELRMSGEARGYAAVALQSEAFSTSPYFKDPIFSDLRLDEEGNVDFTFRAILDPALVSYRRAVEREAITAPVETAPALEVSTSTPQQSSGQAATSTAATSSPTSTQ